MDTSPIRIATLAATMLLGIAALTPGIAPAQDPAQGPVQGPVQETAQSADATLRATRAKATFASNRSGTARHSLKIDALVDPSTRVRDHDPATDTFALAARGAPVLVIHPEAAASGRRQRNGVWKFRSRLATGARAQVRLDPRTGRVRVSLKRANLLSLASSSPLGVNVRLEVGGGAADATLSFATRRAGRVWPSLLPAGSVGPGAGTGGGNGGWGDDPGGGAIGPVAFRSLQRTQTSDLSAMSHEVFRDAPSWQAAYTRLMATPSITAPSVSFPSEQVLVLHLLRLRNPAWSVSDVTVLEVNDRGDHREVVWQETESGMVYRCPPPGVGAPCFVVEGFHAIAIPNSDLPLRFVERP